MGWVKKGVNYWENPDCPKDYLEKSLRQLIIDVEGVAIPLFEIKKKERDELVREIAFFEEVADK